MSADARVHAHAPSALTTGTGAREQPFTLWITTAVVAALGAALAFRLPAHAVADDG